MAAKKKQLEKSLVGRLVAEMDDQDLGGGAIVVSAGDLGVEDAGLGFVDGGRSTVQGGQLGLVVPDSIRRTGHESTPPLLALVDATHTGRGEWTFTGRDGVLFEQPWRVLPDNRWVGKIDPETGEDWIPGTEWLPTRDWVPETPSDLRVVVPSSPESIARRVGLDISEFRDQSGPIRTLRDGETLERDHLLFAAFTDDPVFPTNPLLPVDRHLDPEQLFDAGVPAPLQGASYGFAVLSTPEASVDSEEANPLATTTAAEFLTREETQDVLRRGGLTDAGAVEWLAGPTAVRGDHDSELVSDPTLLRDAPRGSELLEREIELTMFVGIVRGADGPWAVGVDVARASVDDVIFVAGIHRRPVGTADATAVFPGANVARARKLTIETIRRLHSD